MTCQALEPLADFLWRTQFTCFTSTKVQILTPEERRAFRYTQFTCFTGTKVQKLTHLMQSSFSAYDWVHVGGLVQQYKN